MTEPLEPGTVVRSAMASQSIWVKTNHGWVWIDRYTGDVQTTLDHCAMTDAEALYGPEFWVQAWDGRTVKQWDRVGGGSAADPDAFGVVPASSKRDGPTDMWAVTYRGQTLGRFDHLADAEADMLDRHQRAIRDVQAHPRPDVDDAV